MKTKNFKSYLKNIFVFLIILSTINCVKALDLRFNNSWSTLSLDFATDPTQSFYVTVPNEYVLTASMDMEGQPTIIPGEPPNRSDVMLVTDVSGSMDYSLRTGRRGERPTKLDSAILADKTFVNKVNLSYVKVGLVKYASCPTIDDVLPLTNRSNDLLNTINTYDISSSTNIGGGLYYAIQELTSIRAQSGANKYVVLLTDGQANHYFDSSLTCLPLDDPDGSSNNDAPRSETYLKQMALLANRSDIVVYTIGLGTASDVNRDLLQYVAVTTGGINYNVTRQEDLPGIYELIAQSLGTYIYPTPTLTTVLANGSELGWGSNLTLDRNVTWFDKNCGFDGATCLDFTYFIQKAIDSCDTDFCNVTFRVNSNTSGKVFLSNFKINTIQNGKCGKPSCLVLLQTQGTTVHDFEIRNCTDGNVEVGDPFVYKYVYNLYPILQEINYTFSTYVGRQPISGNYNISSNAGDRSTRFQIYGMNVSNTDKGLEVIQVVLTKIPDRPLRFCPILIKKSPYNPMESQDINTELLVSSSRTATGYNSGSFETQGPYVFSVKVWLRK